MRRIRRIGLGGPPYPIGSMYSVFTYIWLIFMVNVGKYTIHGSYGYCLCVVVSKIVYFHPYLGKISILTKGLVQPPTSVWSFREFILAYIFLRSTKMQGHKNANVVELRDLPAKINQKLAICFLLMKPWTYLFRFCSDGFFP